MKVFAACLLLVAAGLAGCASPPPPPAYQAAPEPGSEYPRAPTHPHYSEPAS